MNLQLVAPPSAAITAPNEKDGSRLEIKVRISVQESTL